MLSNTTKFTLMLFLSCFPLVEIFAEPVTFEISATVYNISDPGNAFQNSVNAGDKITGTYTIDIATPDNDPDPQYGHYIFDSTSPTSPQLGFDFLLNNHSLKSDPSIPGQMYEAHTMNSSSDHFGIMSWGNKPLSNGSSVNDIFIDLYDPTGSALTTDALTSQAPNVTAFEWHDIHVSGSAFTGEYYYLDAKIDAIQAVGNQCAPTSSNIVTFNVVATVREVYDYDNVLGSAINVGDPISGTYTFNTDTPDSDPNLEYGRYEHFPGSGNYGFDINIATYNLKTNTSTDMFAVTIGDAGGLVEWDLYSVDQYSTQLPFINNSIIENMGIYIDDPTGTSVNTTALTNQPPALTGTGYKDLFIGGTGTATPGTFFSVVADLNSITQVGGCEEQPDPVVVSPASGVFDVMQHFDAAIVMEAGLPPLTNMQGTLNGFDITPDLYSCFPGTPNSQNRQTFICPGFSNLLMPGNNTLNVNFTLDDGRIIYHTVDWLLLGY